MRTDRLHGERAGDQALDMVASGDNRRVRGIVIVEDDEDIADSIQYNLERARTFRVQPLGCGTLKRELKRHQRRII